MNTERTVEEIESELKKKQERFLEIGPLIDKHEKSILRLQDERRSLRGWNGGEIVSLERELKKARQRLEDMKLIPVILSNGHGEYVVDKVTEKRIFVRVIGENKDDTYSRVTAQFHLDGESCLPWSSDRIDIRATFGIDADELPPKFKLPVAQLTESAQ